MSARRRHKFDSHAHCYIPQPLCCVARREKVGQTPPLFQSCQLEASTATETRCIQQAGREGGGEKGEGRGGGGGGEGGGRREGGGRGISKQTVCTFDVWRINNTVRCRIDLQICYRS